MPEKRAEFVADDPVENASRLLSVDEIDVYLCRLGYLFGDFLFRYLIEGHSYIVAHVKTQFLRQMPRNGFAFAVGVCCEICFFVFRVCRFEFADDCRFSRFSRNDELGLEVVFDIDGETGCRKILYVSDGRKDLIFVPKILFYGLRLCRGLDYEQILSRLSRRFCCLFRSCRFRGGRFLRHVSFSPFYHTEIS